MVGGEWAEGVGGKGVGAVRVGAGSFSSLLLSPVPSQPLCVDTGRDKSSLTNRLGAGAPMDMSEGSLGGWEYLFL